MTKERNGVIELCTPLGSSVAISIFGGQVLSWRPASLGDDLLYLSNSAIFDQQTPIRGGVPVLFPYFGVNELMPSHGFARRLKWRQVKTMQGESGSTAVLDLVHCERTRMYWPYSFVLRITVTLCDTSLRLGFQVENLDLKTFKFSGGLHTYFKVNDINTVAISGLAATPFVEKGRSGVQTERLLCIDGPIDRTYITGESHNHLCLNSPERTIGIETKGFEETVVWNPWAEGSSCIDDMASDDYSNMLCVESVVATKQVSLPAGNTWRGEQHLFVR